MAPTLLLLPLEVRTNILKYHFDLLYLSEHENGRVSVQTRSNQDQTALEVTKTCKQLRAESLRVFTNMSLMLFSSNTMTTVPGFCTIIFEDIKASMLSNIEVLEMATEECVLPDLDLLLALRTITVS